MTIPVVRRRQAGGFDGFEGMTGQNGDTVAFFFLLQKSVKDVLHAQMAGNELSLVMMAAARAVGVDFLHGDDVGVKRVDDSGDAFGADFAIDTGAAVDIIRHHAESGLRLTCLVMRRSFFALRIAAEEMEGDLMKVFAADAAGGSGDVSGVPALDAVGDQEEPSGFFRAGPSMRSIFLGKSQCLLGGIPAGQNDVSGVGVLAELY